MLFEAAESRTLESRSKRISFRVTAEEYNCFQHLCVAHGLRNVSEVVRLAVNALLISANSNIADAAQAPSAQRLETRVETLECRLAALETTLRQPAKA